MHRCLDPIWATCARMLSPGGFLCINIGDATRTCGGGFALYPSHARICMALLGLGLTALPDILWRKPTNAPNKFMGSGMLPAGAYVTYEHEYILVFRKGAKREFTKPEASIRSRSAVFWEERNLWFSDLWSDLLGTAQRRADTKGRERSAAFPLELPFRLVHMYSLQGDTVFDPFAGTGTTALAALAGARNSVNVEWDPDLFATLPTRLLLGQQLANVRTQQRLQAHLAFCEERARSGRIPAHTSVHYGFPVVTRQEQLLAFPLIEGVQEEGGEILAQHAFPNGAEVAPKEDYQPP
jgi:DNA modification methylase